MAAIKTKNLRALNANQFLNLFSNVYYNIWNPSEPVLLNDIRIYLNRKYINLDSSGTTGNTPPTHTSGIASDGSISWTYIEDYQNLQNFGRSVYMSLGKNTDWDFEPIPDTPVDSDDIDINILNNIVGMQKISFSDVRLAVRKYNWTSGITYTHYDPNNTLIDYTTPYYVINSENNIYKCIWNNNVPSTSEPTGINTTDYIYTADGYAWKYLASVDPIDAIKFTTTNFIGVTYKKGDDGSNQWNVQENASKGSIGYIKVLDGGVDYDSPTVTISGTGTGATATAIKDGSGTITGIIITNFGVGYDSTTTAVINDLEGSGVILEVIMSPLNGHGHNLLLELNAKDVIMVSVIEGSQGGYFPVSEPDNDYRQISIVIDPIDKLTGNIALQTHYVGPMHPDYGTATYNEIEVETGVVVHVDNREKITKSGSSKEEFRVILSF